MGHNDQRQKCSAHKVLNVEPRTYFNAMYKMYRYGAVAPTNINRCMLLFCRTGIGTVTLLASLVR